MGARTLALILSAMLLVYLLLLGRTAVLLMVSGSLSGLLLGLALLVFPVVGAWIIHRELRFGFTAQKMSDALEGSKIDLEFDDARAAVQADPKDWRAWFSVALAYDEAGDRRQSRKSMHHAAALFREA
jgi:hypothetical protein